MKKKQDLNSRKHDEHTHQIMYQPRIIGLEGVLLSTNECTIRVDNKIMTQPDNLLFDPTTKKLYSIEYKLHGSNHNFNKAERQLKNREEYLTTCFPDYDIQNIVVYENYKHYKVK